MNTTKNQPIDFGPLWRTVGHVIAGWQTPDDCERWLRRLRAAPLSEREWPAPRTVALPVLLAHRAKLPELAYALRHLAAQTDGLKSIGDQLLVWFYVEAPAESRSICVELLGLLGYVIKEAGDGPELEKASAVAVGREAHRMSRGGEGDPRVLLVRTDRLQTHCILCGADLGPRPVQAILMFPDNPHPTFLGHACGDCLRANSFDLADAIEAHAEWWVSAARDLMRAAQLARAGRFQRPSYEALVAANSDAELDLVDGDAEAS
jgi:hypothetical protein